MSLLYQWMPQIWKLILQAVIHASHMIIHMIYGCSEAICKISFRLVCVKQNYSTCSKCLAYSISVNEALMCNKESDAVHYTPHGWYNLFFFTALLNGRTYSWTSRSELWSLKRNEQSPFHTKMFNNFCHSYNVKFWTKIVTCTVKVNALQYIGKFQGTLTT